MTNQLFALEHVKEKAVDLCLEYGPKVFVAASIMLLGYFAARWGSRVVGRWLTKLHTALAQERDGNHFRPWEHPEITHNAVHELLTTCETDSHDVPK